MKKNCRMIVVRIFIMATCMLCQMVYAQKKITIPTAPKSAAVVKPKLQPTKPKAVTSTHTSQLKSKPRTSPQPVDIEAMREYVNPEVPTVPYEKFTVKGVTFYMIKVEGGTFNMGATPEQKNPDGDELPVHSVTLSNYLIGETEVTQALWEAVMGKTLRQLAKEVNVDTWGVGPNYPMYYMNWHESDYFLTALNKELKSQLKGREFRFPTEAEWEYAARGGNKSKGYRYSGSDNIGDVAWYKANSKNSNHPVKTKLPNELGIYDMSGSVWEWCKDWYDDYRSDAQTNPTGPRSMRDCRVNRGGSWADIANCNRSAYRAADETSCGCASLGLRLALSASDIAEVETKQLQSIDVTFNTNNPEATIYIDGQNRGTIAATYNLAYGEHRIELKGEGYKDFITTISVTPADKVFQFNQEAISLARTFNVKGVPFVMISIESGTFNMGTTSEQQNSNDDEKSVLPVTLSNYMIGETEVTQALWEAVMEKTVTQIANENGLKTWGVGANYPMYNISWDDCQTFIQKLNMVTGQRFRLPTEAEWEFAARGGNKSLNFEYSGSNNIDDVAWYWKNSGDRYLNGTDSDWNSGKVKKNHSKTHPVKTQQPNELGIYDMSGNVSEWCQNSFVRTNSIDFSKKLSRYVRGGGWDDFAWLCRSVHRRSFPPDRRYDNLGFRLALSE